ncbi:MAG: hypothetical protein QG597_1871 [Actinomycetota bacterium]|nr:hypothetical protein [Actinomycetota bacterium]
MSDNDTRLAEAIAALVSAAAATATSPAVPETVLTVDEVADRLKISKSLVYKSISDGQMRSIKIGKRRLIPASEVQRLIKSAA